MGRRIRGAEQLNEGLYRIWLWMGPDVGSNPHTLWARVKTRKEHRCFECETLRGKGSEMLAPIGNQDYRMRRIDLECARAVALVSPIG